jgi:hypothetical protein
MNNIIPGMAIQTKNGSALLDCIVRVLYINKDNNLSIVIPILPKRSGSNKTNMRLYFVGMRSLPLDRINEEISQHKLRLLTNGVKPRADVMATDDELDKKYLRKGQSISIPRKKRAERYAIIQPLVNDHENIRLLFDSQVRSELIKKRANELKNEDCSLKRITKQISEILNQYFAEGSTVGAVTPYSANQGGRGKEKSTKKKRKLGRPNTPTTNGANNNAGFIMSDKDKDICGFAWRNYYIKGSTITKAHRKMRREFYSDISIINEGKSVLSLKGINEHPSQNQFESWGQNRSPGHESWKKQISKFNLNRLGRVLFGTSDSDIIAVGQRGAVDSTSIDVELVSVASRLDRIGTAHRILIVDGLYHFISGFYLGLDAPSTETVGLAFLHSLTDKTEWLKWLGLDDQNPEDWIPIQYGSVTADNTDLRCQAVEEKLASIGTGIKFVGVARSDLNATVETSHHILHRMVDHNMHGTTHGQKHERGEELATVLARHTTIEAIRETARAIYTHNTIELDIQPTLEMRRDLIEKGIKLTRANLTRWEINRGRCHTTLMGEDEALIKLLIPVRGTFTQHGVKLLRTDTGNKREFIEQIRYISHHPLIKARAMKAKVARARVSAISHDDDFLHNPYKPTEIFFKDIYTGELIKLDLVTKDSDLPDECSLPDILDLMKRDAIYSFNAKESRNKTLSELEYHQEQTKENAEEEYQDSLSKLDKPPSKASLKRNKKDNRNQEKGRFIYGMPPQIPENVNTSSPPDISSISDKNGENTKDFITQLSMQEMKSEKANSVSEENNIALAALRKRRERRYANV